MWEPSRGTPLSYTVSYLASHYEVTVLVVMDDRSSSNRLNTSLSLSLYVYIYIYI